MNLYSRFKSLFPADSLLVGEVTAINSDGTSTIVLPGGGIIRARGTGVPISSNAFVQAGEIRGEAPNLPVTQITVS